MVAEGLAWSGVQTSATVMGPRAACRSQSPSVTVGPQKVQLSRSHAPPLPRRNHGFGRRFVGVCPSRSLQRPDHRHQRLTGRGASGWTCCVRTCKPGRPLEARGKGPHGGPMSSHAPMGQGEAPSPLRGPAPVPEPCPCRAVCSLWLGSRGEGGQGSGAVSPRVFCSTTHWKQVLFMMDEPVPVHVGDVVTGSVKLQRSPVWRRHMSLTLSWSVPSGQDPTSQRVRRSAGQSRAVVRVWGGRR